jgi:hypothetical protein
MPTLNGIYVILRQKKYYMTIIESIERQKNENTPVTEDFLKKMNKNTYYSGKEIKVGDDIIFGFLVRPTDTILGNENPTFSTVLENHEQQLQQLEVVLVSFNSEEFGTIYEEDKKMATKAGHSKIPFIKLIENGD